MTDTLNRRQLLLRAASLLVVASAAPALLLRGTDADPVERIRALVAHPASAARLASGTRIEDGAHALVAGLGGTVRIARLSDARLRGAIAALIRADFAAGRTVTADGWVLSLTEARLGALCALG